MANVDGESQLAAAQISALDTLLDQAQEEVTPLVEWALTPMGPEVERVQKYWTQVKVPLH